jgi:uncharacterized repeat protein (TIGR01451 family)/LPXTG-motif cell wall-anchored protein
MNKVFKLNIILFVTLLLGVLTLAVLPFKVEAACESDGAYGEKCIFNKTFELTKKVRLEGDNTWKDKIIDVKEGEVIEFKIEIKNLGEIAVDDMKMTDFLPDELEKIGGSGLTEEWNDFKVGEEKNFKIKARIKPTEFEREDNFEKCIVNKAEATYDGTLEGSDTATVCYGNEEPKELPETGPLATELMAIVGLASTGFGLALKRKR